MKHEIIKAVIYDQHRIIRDFSIVPREQVFEEKMNYILVGIRRSGKSTLLYSKAQELVAGGTRWEQIIFLNFEDERLAEFSVGDFQDVVQTAAEMTDEKPFFFFDEIQNVDGWESFARRMADAKEFVWITGSNAKMLSREMEARLGGRYLSRTIYPYNFREYLDATGVKRDEAALCSAKGNGQIRGAAADYFRFGGFPESVGLRLKKEYADNVYRKILFGDIVARNEIRNANALRLLVKKIAETVIHDVSFSKLHGAIAAVGVNAGKDTVINYVSFAEDAYLLFHVPNYVSHFSERAGTRKYYFTDNGLLNLFLVNKDTALLENIAAIALYRKYGDGLYYLHSAKTGIDIDFVIPGEQLAIQAACSLQDARAKGREAGGLAALARTGTIANRFVIVTYEEEGMIEEGGITIEVIPLYRFLLEN